MWHIKHICSCLISIAFSETSYLFLKQSSIEFSKSYLSRKNVVHIVFRYSSLHNFCLLPTHILQPVLLNRHYHYDLTSHLGKYMPKFHQMANHYLPITNVNIVLQNWAWISTYFLFPRTEVQTQRNRLFSWKF